MISATRSSDAAAATIERGFDRLPSLRDEWERLYAERYNEPSASFEWTASMVRSHVRPDDGCFLVLLRRGDAVVGVVPLVVRRVVLLGVSVAVAMPLSEENNTHSDLLVTAYDADIMRAFVTALTELEARWDCFRMTRLLDDRPLARALEQSAADHGLSHLLRDGHPSYILPLPGSLADYLADRGAKFRNTLKRIERKLRAAGELQVREVSSRSELEEGLDAMMRVERSSWKQEHGTSITAVDRQSCFYRELCEASVALGRLHLQWLLVAGQPVAYNLGYLFGGHYHYLKTSYDNALRPLSPATFLRARLIESLIARGVRQMDFSAEPYEWESQWTDALRWHQVLSIYSGTVRGRLLATADRLRHTSSATERRLQHIDPRTSRPLDRRPS
jgi:CelD/BcsL family acetyltransferase involved in cellulose biosynthesis